MSNSLHARGIIFDLDGTLVDTPSALGASFVDCLARFGKKITLEEGRTLALDLQRQVAGRESTLTYMKAVNKIIKAQGIRGVLRRLKFLKEFIAIYHDLQRQTDAYDGVLELLREIKTRELKIAIATSSSVPEMERIMTKIRDQVMPLVDAIVTRDDVKVVKPDPESVVVAAKQLALDFSELVVIGDSWQDIRAGKQAGTRTIGVLWGFGSENSLTNEKPTQLVSTPAEILSFLDEI
ncbi:MAG TPA: HAD family hydrolase [Candidatus Lokiarchaeia archaeon]|nr:HAD family hydrolase [Candidatus Lokiarchaeia archaeon]